jgi:flagellar export protein FliJ
VVELSWAAVDRAGQAASVAGLVADGERATWSDAARRVKGLERLDERLRAEGRRTELRRRAAVLDDLVTTRVAGRAAS